MNNENDFDKLSKLEDNINNILKNNRSLKNKLNNDNIQGSNDLNNDNIDYNVSSKFDFFNDNSLNDLHNPNKDLSFDEENKGDVVSSDVITPSNKNLEENSQLSQNNIKVSIPSNNNSNININNPINNNDNINNSNNNKLNHKIYIGYEKRLIFIVSIIIISIILFLFFLINTLHLASSKKEYFSENSDSSYSVCLNNNDYYEEECLPQEKEYLSSLVDKVNYTFTYNSLYSTVVEKNYDYNVKAHLKIYSQDNESQTLYEKEYILYEDTNFNSTNTVFTISDIVEIPFKEYNSFVIGYNNTYGLLSNAEVVVDFNVNDKSVSSLSFPLGKTTFNIKKRNTENTVSVDKEIKADVNIKIILYLTILILSGLVNIIFVGILLWFLFKTNHKTDEYSKYKSELDDILKSYDRIIVDVKSVDLILKDKPIIKVDNFLELVDVRDSLDKPIMHVVINNIKNGFYVDDGDKVYSFIMKIK